MVAPGSVLEASRVRVEQCGHGVPQFPLGCTVMMRPSTSSASQGPHAEPVEAGPVEAWACRPATATVRLASELVEGDLQIDDAVGLRRREVARAHVYLQGGKDQVQIGRAHV